MAGHLFLLSSFAFFTLVYGGMTLALHKGRIRTAQRVTAFTRTTKERIVKEVDLTKSESTTALDRILKPVWVKVRKFVWMKMSSHSTATLNQKLMAAGYPFKWTAVDVRMMQGILGLLFFFISLLFISSGEDRGQVFLLALLSGGLGAMYPTYYLQMKKKQRVAAIEKAMPDFFDIVNVSIEAGLGLDAALLKVCKEMKGPLSDEFLQGIDKMKLGKSRREVFSGIRDRIPSQGFQSVMNALIQADQLGIGMAKVLRAQTRRIREQQRQKAKEKAMKAPVKMMIPMVLFIFPTLFIVLLGPVVIQLITRWL